MSLKIQYLGQAGLLVESSRSRFLVDPYLSDYVEERHGPELKRLLPKFYNSENIGQIDAVFMTHAHDDHCDPQTLQIILKTNPNLECFASYECVEILSQYKIPLNKIHVVDNDWHEFKNIRWRGVPAAHTTLEKNSEGCSRFLGFVFEVDKQTIYHAGDMMPHIETENELKKIKIDWGFLPINERNYFRDKCGIIGNMTCREAVQWGKLLGLKKWVPIHWDMFVGNTCSPDELNLIAKEYGETQRIQWLKAGEFWEIEK